MVAEELFEEIVAGAGFHAMEELGAAAGEGEAKAVEGLVGFGGVDADGGGFGGGRLGGEGDVLFSEELRAVFVG